LELADFTDEEFGSCECVEEDNNTEEDEEYNEKRV
jgi:hypothetical protein